MRYAERNYIATPTSGSNDTVYSAQYSLHNTGVYPNAGINIEQAWDVIPSGGSPTIKCGVFDSGLDWKHEDFGYNGVDTNSSKVNGWDFETNAPLKLDSVTDFLGHGTACAGIIGAIRNNHVGIAGIAGGDWTNHNAGVSLYGLKILTPALFIDTTLSITPLTRVADAMVETLIEDTSLPYGYGLHISSNSWSFNEDVTETYADTNITLMTEAVHFANRAKVTFCASRGNAGRDDFAYPAILDDDWVLNVGGTGVDGCYKSGNNGDPWWYPSYGHNVDVGAPSASILVRTTLRGGGYTSFNATSAACPHVTGVVALLMSYINTPSPSYQNLAPEDCEWIIQLSAKDDTCYPGIDQYIGYGLLNAGGAMKLVEKPFNNVNHFGTNFLSSYSKSISLAHTHDTITLPERCVNADSVWFRKGKYIVNTYQINATVNHTLTANDSIVAFWARPSSSTTFPLFDSSKALVPHEKVKINSCNHSSCSMTGYVYQVYDTTGTFLAWLPFDTTLSKAQFEYTVLTHNTLATGIEKVSKPSNWITLYPNPSNEQNYITFNAEEQGDLEIVLFNATGAKVSEVYRGKSSAGYNQIANDVSSLPKGYYTYKVRLGNKIENVPFIKL